MITFIFNTIYSPVPIGVSRCVRPPTKKDRPTGRASLVSTSPNLWRKAQVNKKFNAEEGNKLMQVVTRIDERDAAGRYEVEFEDNKVPRPNKGVARSVDSAAPKKIIAWEDGDPENPYNWSRVRMRYIYS